MAPRIAVVGAGAVGGEGVGGHLSRLGHDCHADRPRLRASTSKKSARKACTSTASPEEENVTVRLPTMHSSTNGGTASAERPDRHRHRLGEIARHRMGDHDDQAISLSIRLRAVPCRTASTRNALPPSSAGAGWSAASPPRSRPISTKPATSAAPSRKAAPAHRLPRRRGPRPRHQTRREPLLTASRRTGRHHQPLGRALVQALPERHAQRAPRRPASAATTSTATTPSATVSASAAKRSASGRRSATSWSTSASSTPTAWPWPPRATKRRWTKSRAS